MKKTLLNQKQSSRKNQDNPQNAENTVQNIQVSVRMRPLLKEFEDQEIWDIDNKNQIIYSQLENINQVDLMSQKNPAKLQETYQLLKRRYGEQQKYRFMFGKLIFVNSIVLKYIKISLINLFKILDKIYNEKNSTYDVYQSSCKNILQKFFEGYNTSLFLYGQTTSGKTYTMIGEEKNPGLIPYVLSDNTNYISTIKVSYLEIYNEQIYDLLIISDKQQSLKIQDGNQHHNTKVKGLQQFQVDNFNQAVDYLRLGEENRSYKEKSMHDHSSRSHTIFQLELIQQKKIGQSRPNNFTEETLQTEEADETIVSVLNLIDLAGSERLNEDDSTIHKAHEETGFINKSLFVLSEVIFKLSNKISNTNANIHIPYRNSKLTRLLQNSLGGNTYTSMICCITPSASSFNQTLSTLRFAQRAQKVQTQAIKNIQLSTQRQEQQLIQQLRQELQELEMQSEQTIQNLKEQNDSLSEQLVYQKSVNQTQRQSECQQCNSINHNLSLSDRQNLSLQQNSIQINELNQKQLINSDNVVQTIHEKKINMENNYEDFFKLTIKQTQDEIKKIYYDDQKKQNSLYNLNQQQFEQKLKDFGEFSQIFQQEASQKLGLLIQEMFSTLDQGIKTIFQQLFNNQDDLNSSGFLNLQEQKYQTDQEQIFTKLSNQISERENGLQTFQQFLNQQQEQQNKSQDQNEETDDFNFEDDQISILNKKYSPLSHKNNKTVNQKLKKQQQQFDYSPKRHEEKENQNGDSIDYEMQEIFQLINAQKIFQDIDSRQIVKIKSSQQFNYRLNISQYLQNMKQVYKEQVQVLQNKYNDIQLKLQNYFQKISQNKIAQQNYQKELSNFQQVILNFEQLYNKKLKELEQEYIVELQQIQQDQQEQEQQQLKNQSIQSQQQQNEQQQQQQNGQLSEQQHMKEVITIDLYEKSEIFKNKPVMQSQIQNENAQIFQQKNGNNQSQYFVWGQGQNGKLGLQIGQNQNQNLPVQAQNWPNFKQVKAGYSNSFGVTHDGQIYTWGQDFGRTSAKIVNEIPKIISVPQKIKQITCGWQHSLALSEQNQVFAWGANYDGQLGIGKQNQEQQDLILNPVQIPLFNQLQFLENQNQAWKIAAGHSHSAVITQQGHLYTFGCNQDGRLFQSDLSNKFKQIQIQQNKNILKQTLTRPTLTCIENLRQIQKNKKLSEKAYKIIDVSLGIFHSIAISENGSIYTAGKDTCGQLGNVHFGEGANIAVQSTCGENFTLILDCKNQLHYSGVIGQNSSSQLKRIYDLDDKSIVNIQSGRKSAFAIGKNGDLYGWGDNLYDQLGILGEKFINRPHKIQISYNQQIKVQQVSCGEHHCISICQKNLK
ncbi:Regulator of chromosome condensation 1/beta-lactamase-inhibitor protein II [Pseudocohnilembus persalinus]|uniref:Regulator of chromosome condensation 1/beta-lactamase-inhibitor protein II n=1 Tax=Pseudocohnilembus persalinus TaxID=266149 RepID=A0A0V0QJG1_PSEPJ|nr:Regulator of chromosome condensation 1/beta-lactamase-inhibitor protein II [Pseudocohnilembus persalinus]|eukprot:KRX02340.1 Regulator of chromosome condensation 1/beta-lactamase-inhibitor protein II [Pseudocohnilembus persalinus]